MQDDLLYPNPSSPQDFGNHINDEGSRLVAQHIARELLAGTPWWYRLWNRLRWWVRRILTW